MNSFSQNPNVNRSLNFEYFPKPLLPDFSKCNDQNALCVPSAVLAALIVIQSVNQGILSLKNFCYNVRLEKAIQYQGEGEK
jgi:hypothetical protein